MLSTRTRRNRPRCAEADVRTADPDGLMQRRPARARQVRIGAAVEQQARQLPVRVSDSHHERARAVGQRVVDVRARVEERLDGVDAAAADREQKRGESGRRRAVEHRPAALEVGDQRLGGGGGRHRRGGAGAARPVRALMSAPGLDEQADRGGVVACRRPHQRGLTRAADSRRRHRRRRRGAREAPRHFLPVPRSSAPSRRRPSWCSDRPRRRAAARRPRRCRSTAARESGATPCRVADVDVGARLDAARPG